MSRSDGERVEDILLAASRLAEIVALGRENFNDNWLVVSAAERQLEIIGVAADNLSDDFTQTRPNLPIRDAKDTRNLISHRYHRSDPDVLWQTISDDVPEFVAILSDDGGPPTRG